MDNSLPNPAPLNPKPFPWKILLVLLIILLLLSTSAGVYLYISLQKQKAASLSTSFPPLPFPLTDTAVSMAGIVYQLKGRIWQITQKETEYEIILQAEDGKVYPNQPLRFSQKSLLTKTKDATVSAENISPKKDDNIFLNYYFDPLKKTGYVTKIE